MPAASQHQPSARRVLVIVQGPLDGRPAGPQIRGREIARHLAGHHAVTIAATTDRPFDADGIPVVPRSRRSLLAAMRHHDVVIGPLLPPYLMAATAGRPLFRIADLYDPVDLEVSTLASTRAARRALATQRALRRMQLRFSDLVVCANGAQRARAREEIAQLGRTDGGPDLLTVGMGLPDPPARSASTPLRARLGIAPGDPLVLWWGSVWRWLDAVTAIKAIHELAARIPAVKLVITAGPPPSRTDSLNAAAEARQVAADLGVLGRNVLFLDEWVPYDERAQYLSDADLGITLHGSSAESPYAARARYLDYIWASVPSVLAEGDELGAEMAAAGAAWLVPPGDPSATAAAIERALAHPETLRAARAACAGLATQYRWDRLLEPLADAIATCIPRRQPRELAGALRRDSAAFYALRALDTCLP